MATTDITTPGYVVPRSVVEQYIRQAAQQRGIDPATALKVYHSEGSTDWQSAIGKGTANREKSYGPFQLYTGGGLGNEFQKQTGLNPADPNTWSQNVDFALDQAKKGGWGPWYGAKAVGVTGFDGIGGQPAAQVAQATPQQPPVNQMDQLAFGSLAPAVQQPMAASTDITPQQAPAATPAATPQLGGALGNVGALAQLFGGGAPAPTPAAVAPPMQPLPEQPVNMQALQALLQQPLLSGFLNAQKGLS